MFPVLFEIPILNGLKIYTYGFLVALGFLAGIAWISHESKRVGLPKQKLVDLCFYIILTSMLGSRLFYAAFEDPSLFLHPLLFLNIRQGGLVFHGGLIAATLFSIYFLRKHRLNFWQVADIFMPAVALGHAIGRIGCFSAGCCYGKPIGNSWFHWGVTFPHHPDTLAPQGIALYPSQLFESGAEFFIFFILIALRKHKKFDGQILLLYLLFYGVARFLIEFLRNDTAPYLGFTAAQFVSVGLLISAGIVWAALRKRRTDSSA